MKGREYFKQKRIEFTKRYYKELGEAKESGKPIAYVTGFLPTEILVAMDIMPYYPETFATLACAFNAADELCQVAEDAGVSRDLCAFSTVAMGSMLSGKGPYGGMPKPDLLISSAYTCGIHVPWWEIMQKHYDVPHFIIDGPVLSADPEPIHIDFFRSELKRLISFLEEQTGRKMDMDRLEEVARLSNVASDYFTKILELRKVVPCPISSHQLCGDMFHITTLPGTEETTTFYEELYADIAERVEQKIGVVEDEQFRLIWDNIPIWHDLALIDYFESKNMVFVYETFFKEYWAKKMIGADPFESLGRKYLTGWTNRRLDRKIEIMSDVVRDYQVDGIVVFENKGCRAYSTGQLDVAESLKETFGIPYLTIEGNMADPGGHDADKVRKMVDNFQEVMRGRSSR